MSGLVRERRVSGERVFDGRAVKLDVDEVVRDDGGQGRREVIRHPGSVVIVALHETDDDGPAVLLVRQFRYAPDECLLELPAGTLEAHDPDPEACARRELAEETGHGAARWVKLGAFYTSPGYTDEFMHCYLAHDLHSSDEGTPDEDEGFELVALPFSEALEQAHDGRLRDAKTLIGLLLAAAHLDSGASG